ncbi:hypothetical protein [Micromonospora sp. WMMD980]|uniref:hypothetical protein n=1 Tax=Micromonospora sp. WMMD980 TaxID=3016088 RepID=UPI002415A4CA|nr:hypothetical protein [Micromonospora sp. WMMD980]MDG4804609.1 hypothetical protein [Micromonospora sp. WMMD980]
MGRAPSAAVAGPPSMVPSGTASTVTAPLAASTRGSSATPARRWNSAVAVGR